MFFGKKLHRLVSFFLSFNLIFQAFSPVIILAQEATQSAESPSETVTPTLEPSATPGPTDTLTPEPTITEEVTPQAEPDLAPLDTPEASLTPDITLTPTPTPEEPTATPSEANLPLAETTPEAPEITTDSSLASLITDKLDYFPTDTVNITGTLFAPVQFYTIYIASADDPAVTHTGTVITNIEGNFTYSYTLDGNYRPNYTIEVRDESGAVVASTTFTDTNWQTIPDTAGSNDEPGQKDLTLLSRELDSTDPLQVKWNWDEIRMNGNNTADACALFDTNNNGFANYSLCVTWENTQIQVSGSPTLYRCNDSREDRCSGASPTAITNGSTCTVTSATNDPFADGDETPKDTQASCSVQLSDVGGATVASLIDVCSYPSVQPNSDPSDCIIIRTDKGRLTITKDVVPDTPNTNWNFTTTGPTNFNASITGDGSSGINSIDLGTYSITEAAGAGTSLNDYSTSWSCTKNGGAYSSGTGATASGIVIGRSGNVEDSVVCTFTNTLQQGTLLVHKVYTDQANIPVTINVLSGLTQIDSKSTTAGDASFPLNTGTYSAQVASEPAGYHQQSTTCDNVSVVAGQTTECTITNTHDTGSLQVNKNVDLNGDGDYTDQGETGATDWTWDISGGEQNIATGQTRTLNTGTYTISEDGKTNFHLVDWACSDGTSGITNSISANVTTTGLTCTFNNAHDTGTIIVHKDVVGPNGEALTDTSSNFGISLDGSPVQTLTDGGTVTYYDVLTGNHTVTEPTIPSGYSFFSITNGGNITVTTGDNHVYVVNRQQSATLTVVKNVLNPDGAEVVDNHSFAVTVGTQTDTAFGEGDNALFTLAVGTYDVIEGADGNYDFVSVSEDSDPNTAGYQVHLNPGEQKTITLTNKQKKATITVIKDVVKYDLSAVADNNIFSVFLNGQPKDFSENASAVFTVNPGNYAALEDDETNYTFVSNSGAVSVGSNGRASITITNKQNAGLISGYKYDATTGLGIFGWTINLSGASTQQTQTDINGFYQFLGLNTGSYTVTEAQPAGWTPVGPTSLDVTIAPDTASIRNNFTNFEHGHISGHKFNDLNRNGVWDHQTEPALSGWKIWLDRPTGDNLYRTTDANGYYNFPDLGPGQYIVFEENQTGWDQTAPVGDQYVIEMTSNGDFQDRDFGNFHIEPAVSIEKILSATTNSEILIGDTATFTITITNDGNVTLLNPVIYDTYDASFLEFVSSSPVSPTTHTSAVADSADYDGDGNTSELIRDLTYTLPVSLAPGASYTLTLNFKALQITPDFPVQTYTGNEAYTSACYEQCGDGQSIQTPTDNAFVDIDTLGSVSGRKFVDTNGNRVWDDGESTLNGVTINLVNAAGVTIKTTSTSGDGSYSFDSITTGDYTICEIIPTGYAQTYPTGNACHPLTVTDDGGSFGPFNFGNQIRGSIKIIKDAKPNNAQNFTFTSPQFTSFQLDDDGDATLPNNKTISDLGSNTYTVTENTVSGWKLTGLSCVGDDNSSVDLDGRTATIRLDRPGENITCTFTNTKYGSLTGRKYNDLNGSGSRQTGEPYLDGWTIKLFNNQMQELDSVVTGSGSLADGQYKFTNLLPGTYYICEDLQDGWTQTDPSSGQTYNETYCRQRTVTDERDVTGVHFGNFKLGKVSGYKWNDLNGDGAWDKENEPSLEDWTINLGEQSTTTDAEGYYEFDNLSAGSYALSEENQTNWSPTKTPDSPVTVTSGLDLTDQNFGNRGNGTIIVHKDIVGTQTDPTQFCFTLSPDPDQGQVCADANGDAVFNDVPSGSYTASETAAAANYTETETTCDQSMTITNGGDELSCTVTNTRDQGTVTFEKIVDDESDVSAWNFTIDGVDGTFNSGNQVTLDTGTYTVTESGSADYTPDSATGICSNLDGSSAILSVTKDGGTCTFTNLVNKGTITVAKVTNPAESEESFDFDLGGESSGATTLSDGESDSFENLFPGNYSLSEDTPAGWDLTTRCLDGEENSIDPSDINLNPGETINCTFTNTKHGTITIVKDAAPDNDQAFRFTGDLGQFSLTDSGGEESSNSQTFEKSAGEYSVTEPAIRGWELSSISCSNEQNVNINNRNVVINLQPGENITCTFINTYVSPKLNLTKSNDALTDRTPGGSVTFTLTLSVLDNDVTGAKVIDLPAKGFTYRPGSWQVKINGLPVDTIAEPQYRSPGKWNLGDLLAGDIVELSYIADIDSTQTPGLYDDLAWANGQGLGGVITAKGSDGAFVGSDVNVIKDNQDTPTREVEKKEVIQGQVLGATTLPATGADTRWLYLAIILSLLGTTSLSAGIILKRKHE